MNKKLLFAAMSLAALTACTNDEFQSKQQIAQESSPIQFEVINNAFTRASMDGNKIVWNANDGDLFTLYHGAAPGAVAGHQNATYTANAEDGKNATLSTPSMIKAGAAVMVWPVDSTFHYDAVGQLTIKIPAVQGGIVKGKETIQNQIPYMSDEINIGGYDADAPYNTAGLNRSYPVYMRPMASQINLKADYAGTDAILATLEDGEDGIEPIKLTSVDLRTTGTTDFTTEIGVAFTGPGAGVPGDGSIKTQWNDAVPNNAWDNITGFDLMTIPSKSAKLTTKCLKGNESCKFLVLPQANMAAGVDAGGVVVNTIYGKVVIADGVYGSQYTNTAPGDEIDDAWYRFVTDPTDPVTAAQIDAREVVAAAAETSGDNAGKWKIWSKPQFGMAQTINVFSAYTAKSGVVKGEPVGAAATRYVKVLLNHLDMSELHVKSDKQLRDAARVWQKMGLATVTVYLDGDATNHEFEISQKTIKTINDINAAAAAEATPRSFAVKPCNIGKLPGEPVEYCETIVITGASEIQNVQDMTFITKNAAQVADVALKAGETWAWSGVVKVAPAATLGIDEIINRGTLVNAANATLQTFEADGVTQVNVPFVNAKDAIWNITAGTLNVQFDVTNYGTVNISEGAQYRQDGRAFNTLFTNEATALPTRFGGDDSQIGLVDNSGVFATVEKAPNKASIYNYGLIEHRGLNVKTYITKNETAGASFSTPFGAGNKMGRINLAYKDRQADNVSISNVAAGSQEGFVSVTVNGEVTGALQQASTELGKYVNYVIVNAGPKSIASLSNKINYLEVNMTDKSELAWSVTSPTAFDGLMVLTDVNIKLGTTVTVNKATFLADDGEMYVGGKFTNAGFAGYYGNTTGNVETNYITY